MVSVEDLQDKEMNRFNCFLFINCSYLQTIVEIDKFLLVSDAVWEKKLRELCF